MDYRDAYQALKETIEELLAQFTDEITIVSHDEYNLAWLDGATETLSVLKEVIDCQEVE